MSKQKTTDKDDLRKAQVLARFVAGDIAIGDAARLLAVTPRHAQRLRNQFVDNGMQILPHGNHGRPPANRTDQEVVRRVLELAGESGVYSDFNICHLCDILAEREGISIPRSTLDRILRAHHLRQAHRAKPKVKRMRRERAAAEGMLLQIDGSPHDWLEGRGPRMHLIGAIDDATGKVIYATFRPTEDQIGYLTMMRQIALGSGLPMAYYHDRHTMLRSPKPATIDDELAGREPQSQLQRVMFLLGIESIAAHSPEAKGRCERNWQTLQDRLVKEMRLAGICTREAANAFLPDYIIKHSARFGVIPRDPNPAWVPIEPQMDLCYYFSTQESRVVAKDHVVSWYRRCLLVLRRSGQPSLAGKRIHVHVVPEGEVYLYDGTVRLEYRELGERPHPTRSPIDQQVPPQTKGNSSGEARRRAWLFGHQE